MMRKNKMGRKLNIEKWLNQFRPIEIDEKFVVEEKYDELTMSGDDYLGGRLDKKFVRCDRVVVEELVREIANNPNSTYISYLNDAIRDGAIPQMVSILKKEHIAKGIAKRESVASRILNYFGVPTSYNFVVVGEEDNQSNIKYGGSVDFIGKNQRFYSLQDLRVVETDDIDIIIEAIRKRITETFKFDSEEEKQRNIDKVIDDYVLTFLVRKYLFRDEDFYHRNFGVLYNEKTHELQFVNYDYEFCMDMCWVGFKDLHESLYNTTLYIRQKYPHVYEKFMAKVNEIYEAYLVYGLEKTSKFNRFSLFYNDMCTIGENAESVIKHNKLITRKEKIRRLIRRVTGKTNNSEISKQ